MGALWVWRWNGDRARGTRIDALATTSNNPTLPLSERLVPFLGDSFDTFANCQRWEPFLSTFLWLVDYRKCKDGATETTTDMQVDTDLFFGGKWLSRMVNMIFCYARRAWQECHHSNAGHKKNQRIVRVAADTSSISVFETGIGWSHERVNCGHRENAAKEELLKSF